jgi:hypothetical protein
MKSKLKSIMKVYIVKYFVTTSYRTGFMNMLESDWPKTHTK